MPSKDPNKSVWCVGPFKWGRCIVFGRLAQTPFVAYHGSRWGWRLGHSPLDWHPVLDFGTPRRKGTRRWGALWRLERNEYPSNPPWRGGYGVWPRRLTPAEMEASTDETIRDIARQRGMTPHS